MTDEVIRQNERSLEHSPATVAERLRAGDLSHLLVSCLAALGHPACVGVTEPYSGCVFRLGCALLGRRGAVWACFLTVDPLISSYGRKDTIASARDCLRRFGRGAVRDLAPGLHAVSTLDLSPFPGALEREEAQYHHNELDRVIPNGLELLRGALEAIFAMPTEHWDGSPAHLPAFAVSAGGALAAHQDRARQVLMEELGRLL